MNLGREIEERRMLDSFGGYDWGDPIILWTAPRHWPIFTIDQLVIAERVLANQAAAS
ncbi:MAG TPA: hypothetical protein VGI56_09955 [Galbitalea sp.]